MPGDVDIELAVPGHAVGMVLVVPLVDAEIQEPAQVKTLVGHLVSQVECCIASKMMPVLPLLEKHQIVCEPVL